MPKAGEAVTTVRVATRAVFGGFVHRHSYVEQLSKSGFLKISGNQTAGINANLGGQMEFVKAPDLTKLPLFLAVVFLLGLLQTHGPAALLEELDRTG